MILPAAVGWASTRGNPVLAIRALGLGVLVAAIWQIHRKSVELPWPKRQAPRAAVSTGSRSSYVIFGLMLGAGSVTVTVSPAVYVLPLVALLSGSLGLAAVVAAGYATGRFLGVLRLSSDRGGGDGTVDCRVDQNWDRLSGSYPLLLPLLAAVATGLALSA